MFSFFLPRSPPKHRVQLKRLVPRMRITRHVLLSLCIYVFTLYPTLNTHATSFFPPLCVYLSLSGDLIDVADVLFLAN